MNALPPMFFSSSSPLPVGLRLIFAVAVAPAVVEAAYPPSYPASAVLYDPTLAAIVSVRLPVLPTTCRMRHQTSLLLPLVSWLPDTKQ